MRRGGWPYLDRCLLHPFRGVARGSEVCRLLPSCSYSTRIDGRPPASVDPKPVLARLKDGAPQRWAMTRVVGEISSNGRKPECDRLAAPGAEGTSTKTSGTQDAPERRPTEPVAVEERGHDGRGDFRSGASDTANQSFPTKPRKTNSQSPSKSEGARVEGLCIKTPSKSDSFSAPELANIQLFNEALVKASQAIYTDARRIKLWRSYCSLSSTALQHIPDAAWERLWHTQIAFRPDDPERINNVERLLKDIDEHGKNAPPARKLRQWLAVLRLEKMYIDETSKRSARSPPEANASTGEAQFKTDSQALRIWDEVHTANTQREGRSKTWLELGARLFAQNGDFQRVQDVVTELGKRFHNTDPRLGLQMVLALNTYHDPTRTRKAWALYRTVQGFSKFSLLLPDYTQVFNSFFANRELSCALGVLSDILSSNTSNRSHRREFVMEALENMRQSCETTTQVDELAVTALSILPREVHDQAFFERWLHHSCRTGSINDIAKIIELMFEKRVRPTIWQFNKLLEVWFRSEDPTLHLRGQQVALKMIERRVGRSAGSGLSQNVFKEKAVPPAAALTFLRLARHFALVGEIENAKSVLTLLQVSDVKLSTKIIDAVLSVHYAMNDWQGAWSYYMKARAENGFLIGLSTFKRMWTGLLLQLSRHLSIDPSLRQPLPERPNAREIFKEMMQYSKSTAIVSTRARIPEKPVIYSLCIRAFCLSRDTIGALVAMQTLERVWNLTPNAQTVRTVTAHVAHNAVRDEKTAGEFGRKFSRRRNVRPYQQAATQLLYNQISSRTHGRAGAVGVDPKTWQAIATYGGGGLRKHLSRYLGQFVVNRFNDRRVLERKRAKAVAEMEPAAAKDA